MRQLIRDTAEQLRQRKTSSLELTEHALARIADSAGEGKRTFLRIYESEALKSAEAADARIASTSSRSLIDGLPISIKDLFDVAGEVTSAASTALQNHAPALRDAEIVARLRRAGAVIVGKTNMSEFAFTGVGMNPHFGTPANPYDRGRRRIPGGSSSGAPVSVADGMAVAAIGTDTGGSVRIPAALCGLVGLKPTQRRVSRTGVFPLSPTLDSVGVIANSVSCCAEVDAVLSGESWVQTASPPHSLIVAVPQNYFLDDLEKPVAQAFEAALRRLSAAGVRVKEVHVPETTQIAEVNSRGGISAPEAYAYHRRMAADLSQYDPFVRERIVRGKEISAAEYLDMLHTREELMLSFNSRTAEWDFLMCPTVPIIAPEIAALEQSPELYRRVNRLLLRNPNVVNFVDGCAVSIPYHEQDGAPVGLMIIGRTLDDHKLLNAGLTIESLLASS